MKKLTGFSLFVFFCVVSAILTAGLVFYQNNNLNNISKTSGSLASLPTGTILNAQEVAKHNTNADCWIIVNNKIYNISNYASSHPGGSRNILNYCGKEATVAFDTKGGGRGPHSPSANSMLAQFYVGDLGQKVAQNTSNQSPQNTTKTSNNVIGNTTNPGTVNNNPTPTSGTANLSAAEVAKHNTNADCWIIVNNKIYNISNYASSHPGGSRNILNYCGKEATVAFDTKGGGRGPHSPSANSMLAQFYVGDLGQNVSQANLNQTVQNIQANPPPVNTRGGDDD